MCLFLAIFRLRYTDLVTYSGKTVREVNYYFLKMKKFSIQKGSSRLYLDILYMISICIDLIKLSESGTKIQSRKFLNSL